MVEFFKKRNYLQTILTILLTAVVVLGSVKMAGNTTNVDVEVDTTSKAMRTTLYDTAGNVLAYDTDLKQVNATKPNAALGHYSLAVKTGSLAATIAANSPLFSARWGDATRLAVIERICVNAYTISTITASVPVDFELVFARTFTANDTGGTSVLPAANQNERRTSFGTTLFTDMRISSTAALGAGTRTLDTNALSRTAVGITGTTAPVRWFLQDQIYLWDSYAGGGVRYPIVLAQNEGIIIRNSLVGPATGTWGLYISLDWYETTAY